MNTLKEIPVIGKIKHPLRWLIGRMGACGLQPGYLQNETRCKVILSKFSKALIYGCFSDGRDASTNLG